MTQANFYLLSEKIAYYPYICRLVEKIYRMKLRIYLLSNNEAEVQTLDRLLWEFRDDSFVPHEIYQQQHDIIAPVILGHNLETLPKQMDVLVNLATTVPHFYTQFSRVIEVVGNDAKLKQQCREKYKYYQQNEIQIITHTVN